MTKCLFLLFDYFSERKVTLLQLGVYVRLGDTEDTQEGAILIDGSAEGRELADGRMEAASDGKKLGSADGRTEGSSDGKTLGSPYGGTEGSSDDEALGSSDGRTEGASDGKALGSSDGRTEGASEVRNLAHLMEGLKQQQHYHQHHHRRSNHPYCSNIWSKKEYNLFYFYKI
jgi:hypothetical protein